jgi:DNA-binding PadR family transcriptional regulator
VDVSLNSTQANFALEAAVWIMVGIADTPRHGYAIMKEIRSLGGFSMPPGTLYAALARMERDGLVEEIQTSDYRQRPYRLTSAGKARLAADLQILSGLVASGTRRLKRQKPKRGERA